MFPETELIERPNKKPKKWIIILSCILGFLLILYLCFLSAPFGSSDLKIHIPSGRSFSSISKELKEKKSIRNELAFKIFIQILKSGKGIISGDYLIEKNTPVFTVAWQLGRGHHNLQAIKVTIREGLNNNEITELLFSKIPNFDKELFLINVRDKQGYLFPDTYFLYPLDTTEEIIAKMSSNFENRIKSISSQLNTSERNLDDIIIMASILEGEASGKDDAPIISGILWKRISLGMPLQVDVLRSTYKEKGLPEAPINNPGLVTIKAAANPVSSTYLYYLHDKNGKVHFARSYDEHRLNIDQYLK